MQTCSDCIPCFIRQANDAVSLVTDDENIHIQVTEEVSAMLDNIDITLSPPLIAHKMHKIIRKMLGIEDPYQETKKRFNEIALRLYPQLRHRVINSNEPLDTAIRLAIAGNIIDFGANGQLQESDLNKTIKDCLNAKFTNIHIDSFRHYLDEARDILYLLDNAGEIVFDRLLIELLPTAKITAVVKDFPVINDATMDDAQSTGLTNIVEVIDNGTNIPGTHLESCCEYFKNRFESSDLVIAKGQGNYETLSAVDKNIFFILKAKCPVIARDIGCKVGQMVFQRAKAFKGENRNAWI